MAASAQQGPTGPPAPPDTRFTLANERTFLAYMRTALGLVAGAVAVTQLGDVRSSAVRFAVAGVLLALAVCTVGLGFLRWRSVEAALAAGGAAPHTRVPLLLAAGLFVVCAGAAVLIALA